MNLDDIPTGQPLTVGQFAAALTAGAELHAPWEEPPPVTRPALVQLDADLRFVQLKREAAARERLGELAHYSHLLHDADPDAATRPFPDLCKGVAARLIDGGKA